MLKKFLKSKHFPLLLILLIAIITRFYRLYDYTEFLGDQGRDVVIIRDFLKNGDLFFIGPQTSVGNMYLGPYFYYLITPALLLANFNPVGPAAFIALLGVATVFCIYLITKKWFNTRAALIASFLFAISPVAIKYSNFIWNPNIMPFFALLFIYFVGESLIFKKYKNLLFAAVCFIMTINSHYLALLLLPSAGIFWLYRLYIILSKDKKELRPFALYTFLAVTIFLISLLPQVLFDIKHNGQNIKSLISFFTYRETTVNIKAYKAFPNMIPLFNQINTSLLSGKNIIFGIFSSIFLFIGSLFTFLKYKNSQNNNRFQLLLLIFTWYLFGLIGLGLYKQHIYDHYFGFLFPVVFILAALAIDKLSRVNKIGSLAAILVLIFLTFYSLKENPLRYNPSKQLSTTKTIVSSIIQDSDSQPLNLALLAKQNYDPPYRYFFYESNTPIFDLHDKITEQLYVICEPWQIACEPINNPQWEIAAFGWAKIDKSWEINGIKIFRLIHNKTI